MTMSPAPPAAPAPQPPPQPPEPQDSVEVRRAGRLRTFVRGRWLKTPEVGQPRPVSR
jgi:hypothetical protein